MHHSTELLPDNLIPTVSSEVSSAKGLPLLPMHRPPAEYFRDAPESAAASASKTKPSWRLKPPIGKDIHMPTGTTARWTLRPCRTPLHNIGPDRQRKNAGNPVQRQRTSTGTYLSRHRLPPCSTVCPKKPDRYSTKNKRNKRPIKPFVPQLDASDHGI